MTAVGHASHKYHFAHSVTLRILCHMYIYSSIPDTVGHCSYYWIESKFTSVIAETVAAKYKVLIAFHRYNMPLFCHACGPLPEELY